MGDLALDTEIEGGDGRYQGRPSEEWAIWGPMGGYIAAFALRARSGVASIALPPAAKTVLESNRTIRTIAVAFGTPYLLREVPHLGTYLVAYGPQPLLQRAVLDALHGDAPVTGKLPVSIPGLYKRGHGLTKPAGSE